MEENQRHLRTPMSAKSKSQQKLFAVVYAYQQGKIPADKVNTTIKKIAKSISPEDAKKFASTLQSGLHEVVNTPSYIRETLHEIIETKRPDYVKGRLVDTYTASLLSTVFNKLNETNQQKFVSKSLDQMVALAYKMVTE